MLYTASHCTVLCTKFNSRDDGHVTLPKNRMYLFYLKHASKKYEYTISPYIWKILPVKEFNI